MCRQLIRVRDRLWIGGGIAGLWMSVFCNESNLTTRRRIMAEVSAKFSIEESAIESGRLYRKFELFAFRCLDRQENSVPKKFLGFSKKRVSNLLSKISEQPSICSQLPPSFEPTHNARRGNQR